MATAPEFEALLAQSSWIHALARRLVADPATADDLAQETWLDALRRRPDTERPIQAWLAAVMRNNLGKLRRGEANRRARESVAARGESLPSTLDVVERASAHRDVVHAVLDLKEPYRSTILMRYFEQLSYDEIGTRAGITRAAVNSRITRGLEQLRGRLESQYGGRRAFVQALAPLARLPAPPPSPLLGAKTVGWIAAGSLPVVLGVALSGTFGDGGRSRDTASVPARLAPADEARHDAGAGPVPDAKEVLARRPAADQPVAPSPAETVDASSDELQQDEAQEWSARIHHATLLATEIGSLRIDFSAGDVEIATSRSAHVEIEAVVHARTDGVASEGLTHGFFDHIRLVEEAQELDIRDTHRGEPGWRLEVVVRVPDQVAVDLNTDSGDITIRRHEARVRANTGSGAVRVETRGPIRKLDANTASGPCYIDIAGLEPDGLLVVNTGSGDVTARVGDGRTRGKMRLSSASGDVSLAIPRDLRGEFILQADEGSVGVDAELELVVQEERDGYLFLSDRAAAKRAVFRMATRSGRARLELREEDRER